MTNGRRTLFVATLVVAAFGLGALPAHAGGGHGHGHGHGGPNVVVSVGGPGYWYGPRGGYWGGPWGWRRPYYYAPYPTYYGYYPAPPVVYAPQPIVVQQPAPVYIEREPAPPPPPAESYWYYCPSRRGYYPTVDTCPEPWLKVAAETR